METPETAAKGTSPEASEPCAMDLDQTIIVFERLCMNGGGKAFRERLQAANERLHRIAMKLVL